MDEFYLGLPTVATDGPALHAMGGQAAAGQAFLGVSPASVE